MTVKTSTASNGLDLSRAESPPSPPGKSEPKKISRLTFSVDSLLNTVAKSAVTASKIEAEAEEPPVEDEDEDIDVESEDDEEVKTEPEDNQSSPNLVHPRPLLASGQPPFLAAGLAAMAAAAAAGKQDGPNPALFPGLNGFPSPAGMPPGFPPLGFPGLPHPFFKPGNN